VGRAEFEREFHRDMFVLAWRKPTDPKGHGVKALDRSRAGADVRPTSSRSPHLDLAKLKRSHQNLPVASEHKGFNISSDILAQTASPQVPNSNFKGGVSKARFAGRSAWNV